MTIHPFTGPRVKPTQADIDQVGGYLDELKKRWEDGEIGSIVFMHNDPDGNCVRTGWSLLPGIGKTDALGWASILTHDLLKALENGR